MSFFQARDVARCPGDIGFATTEVERRRFEPSSPGLDSKKNNRYPIGIGYLFRARDGDRTRDPLLGKEMLHRWATRAYYVVRIELIYYIKSIKLCQ